MRNGTPGIPLTAWEERDSRRTSATLIFTSHKKYYVKCYRKSLILHGFDCFTSAMEQDETLAVSGHVAEVKQNAGMMRK